MTYEASPLKPRGAIGGWEGSSVPVRGGENLPESIVEAFWGEVEDCSGHTLHQMHTYMRELTAGSCACGRWYVLSYHGWGCVQNRWISHLRDEKKSKIAEGSA